MIWRRSIPVVLFLGTLTGCSWSFQRWDYTSALRDLEKREYRSALKTFTKVVRRSPESEIALEAARKASRVAVFDVKDFASAAEFYRHLVLYSPDSTERVLAQRNLADIYFEHLLDFDHAILEYNRLIKIIPALERPPLRLKIAKAYYNQNNYSQALIETDELLSQKIDDQLRFDGLLFKGNILQAAKRLDEAIVVFEGIIKKFPERAERENVNMSLAVSYEEKSDFKSAIEILESIKAKSLSPEFIEVRINRLRERMTNLPGAQGPKR